MDFLGSLAFLAFLIYYRRRQLLVRKEIETKHITAADYTIHIRNLPQQAILEEELEEYFSVYGEVACVTICHRGYAEQARLVALRERAAEDIEEFRLQTEAPHRFPKAAKYLSASIKTHEQCSAELLRCQRQTQQLCCGHAFLTFSLESDFQRCLKEFSGQRYFFGNFIALFGPVVAPCNKEMAEMSPPPLVRQDSFRAAPPPFRGCKLHVTRAPQVSDILWENLEVSSRSRALRQAATSGASFLLVVLATGLIALVNAKHFFFGHVDFFVSELLNLCATLIIIFGNVTMFVFIPILSGYEAHLTKSSKEVHVMLRLWFFQILNTLSAAAMFWDASRTVDGRTNWAHWFAGQQPRHATRPVLIGRERRHGDRSGMTVVADAWGWRPAGPIEVGPVPRR
jgi:hypothetical protein